MKTLAGMALVGLVVAGCPVETDAGVKKVEIEIDSNCKATIDSAKTVSKKEGDVLVFSFTNECKQAQRVFVCVRERTGTTHAEPWHECEGLPKSAPAQVGKQFKIDANTATGPSTAHALCTVDWPVPNSTGTFESETFCLQVVNGPANDSLTCPRPAAKCPPPSRGSELELEVQP